MLTLTCCQNAILLASKCHQIDLSIFHLYIGFIFVTINKKKTCQYLYFKMLLYISQNTDMSVKLRHYDTLMSVFLFVIITFLFQF